jgi:membrane protein DedA with SNARE-associated domain
MESFLIHAGYAAIILLGFLEACCVPIPSEVTFGFGGVLAYQGHLSLAVVIILGTLAEVAGSYVSYTVGRISERPLIEKFGRYLLISRADIDRAERFLAGRGAWAIPLGRTLPFVRSFTSVVAGLTGVPALRFGILSLIGTTVYATIIASAGYAVGSAWHSVAHDLSVVSYLLAAVVIVAIAGFVTSRLRRRQKLGEHDSLGELDRRVQVIGSVERGQAGDHD